MLMTAPFLAAQDNQNPTPGFFPPAKENFRVEPSVTARVGILGSFDTLDPALAYGGKVSFNCLLAQPPAGAVRTEVSYLRSSTNGIDLNILELNPTYYYEVVSDLYLGAGPGLGYQIITGSADAQLWAAQATAAVEYRLGTLVCGVNGRYQWQFGESGSIAAGDLSNYYAGVHLGVLF